MIVGAIAVGSLLNPKRAKIAGAYKVALSSSRLRCCARVRSLQTPLGLSSPLGFQDIL